MSAKVSCWDRLKFCLCCCEKEKKLTRKDADVDDRVTKATQNSLDPIALTAIRVKPKHHFGNSTDVVTMLECLQQEKLGFEAEEKSRAANG